MFNNGETYNAVYASCYDEVTPNNVSDYRTNGLYRTPNPNVNPIVRKPESHALLSVSV